VFPLFQRIPPYSAVPNQPIEISYSEVKKAPANTEWRQYCKGELTDKPLKPDSIPADPNQVYKGRGWEGVGDWLGTGTVAPFNRKYRPFAKARTFVHELNLKSRAEWSQYCKGELTDKPPKPDDIPAGPVQVYKGQGWEGVGDWLGTGTVAPFNRKYLPFAEARTFVHELSLKSKEEWSQYCKGEMSDEPPKPEDIPATPKRTYKDKGWSGFGDWLGTGTVAPQDRKYLPFDKARDIVHILNLKNSTEWRRYCKGEFPDKPPKPEDIPARPHRTYKNKGWAGIGDWLGVGLLSL